MALEPSENMLRDRTRQRSKLLFGNRDTLDVAVAVAESGDGVVNATHLSSDIGLAPNRVRAQLDAFAELGFLTEAPTSERQRWFVRNDHAFWSFCTELRDTWRASLTS